MRKFFCQCGLRHVVLLAILALLPVHSGVASVSSGAVCAQTAAAAVRLAQGEVVPAAEGKGYRVTGISWDPVLRQNRATVENCDHPEWPARSILIAGTGAGDRTVPVSAQQPMVPAAVAVRAGEVVRLWRHEDKLRIETTGVAERNGSVGATIRVRLLRRDTGEPSPEKEITGTVRGPGSVEMQP